jgi:hypothetical protein
MPGKRPGWMALTGRDTSVSMRDVDYVKPEFPVLTEFLENE